MKMWTCFPILHDESIFLCGGDISESVTGPGQPAPASAAAAAAAATLTDSEETHRYWRAPECGAERVEDALRGVTLS